MLGEVTEPCALADVIVAAVRLSDAGLGDYWMMSIMSSAITSRTADDRSRSDAQDHLASARLGRR